MKLRPLLDKVVLKKAEALETTKAGIILPDSAKEKPEVSVIVAVGPGGIVDGKEVWDQGFICFDVPLTQINILRENFQKLLRGENINHEDYTH